MNGAASRGLRTRQPAMRRAPGRVRRSARSRCARNAIRGAARSPRATKPESRYSTTTVQRSSRARSTMPTDNSATRYTTGAHSCRARCTRMALRAAIATIRTAESCAPKATASARRVTCQAKYDTATHHHHKPTSAGAACVACHMPSDDLYGRRSAARSQLARSAPGSVRRSSARQTPVTTVTQSRRALGGGPGENLVRSCPQGYQRFAAVFSAASAGATDAQGQLRAIAADATHPAIVRATALAQLNASDSQRSLETFAEGLREPNPLLRLAALQSLCQRPFRRARVISGAPPLRSIESAAHRGGERARACACGPIERRAARRFGTRQRRVCCEPTI